MHRVRVVLNQLLEPAFDGDRRDLVQRTQPQLSRETGLARGTVDAALRQLRPVRREDETGDASSAGGRKPTLYGIDPDKALAIGVDFDHDRVVVVMSNLAGQPLWTKGGPDDPSERRFAVDEDPEGAVHYAAELIREGLAAERRPLDEVVGIGVGLAAPIVEEPGGRRRPSPKVLKRWANFDVSQALRDELGSRDLQLRVGNDANLAALAEARHGLGRQLSHLVWVKTARGPIGIGAGIYTPHGIYRGASGWAGELGHVIVRCADDRAPTQACPHCNRPDCLQQIASASHVVSQISDERRNALNLSRSPSWEQIVQALRDEHNLPDPHNTTAEGQKARRLADAVAAACTHLGAALATVVTLLNPQAIVLGRGGLADAAQWLRDHGNDPLRAALREFAIDDAKTVRLELSVLVHPVAEGAAQAALENYAPDYLLAYAEARLPQAA
jgi:N-acetylglucosamine repressor